MQHFLWGVLLCIVSISGYADPSSESSLKPTEKPNGLAVQLGVLYGKVIGDPVVIAINVPSDLVLGDVDPQRLYSFETNYKWGYRAAIEAHPFTQGASLHLKGMYVRSRGMSEHDIDIQLVGSEFFNFYGSAHSGFSAEDNPAFDGGTLRSVRVSSAELSSDQIVHLKYDQRSRYYTLDLFTMAQPIVFNPSFQLSPYGGLRYLRYSKHTLSRLDYFIGTVANFVNINTIIMNASRVYGLGVVIGAHLDWYLTKGTRLFGGIGAGLLNCRAKAKYLYRMVRSDSGTRNIPGQSANDLAFHPQIEARFGIECHKQVTEKGGLRFTLYHEVQRMLRQPAAEFVTGNVYYENTISAEATGIDITLLY